MTIRGDMNQDGTLNAQDLNFLRQMVQQNPELLTQLSKQEKTLLDMNQDGQIDYNDVIALCTKIIDGNTTKPQDTINRLTELRNKLRK